MTAPREPVPLRESHIEVVSLRGFVRVFMVSDGNTRPPGQVNQGGRPRSIPESAWPEAFRLRRSGLGYHRIARELERIGVWASRGSVERLIKGRGCYHPEP